MPLLLATFDEENPEFAARCSHCDRPFVQDHPYLHTPGGVALCVECAAALRREAISSGYSEEDGECCGCGESPFVYEVKHVGRICGDCMGLTHVIVAQARKIERRI